MDKRTFLKMTSSATALTAVMPQYAFSKSVSVSSKKVLILGGRGFLGPTIVKTFLEANYEVTLLNRGRTNPHLFKELPVIICDRETENLNGLKKVASQIKDTYWDVVVDTWSKSPKAVADFFKLFKGYFRHYHYTSSIAVYRNFYKTDISESEPVKDLPEMPKTFDVNYPYSIQKALSEKAIIESGASYTIHRSHGMRAFRIPEPQYEPYWPVKFKRGGDIVLPLENDHYLQVTDVVSYCNFILTCTQKGIMGVFNVAYPRMEFISYIDTLSGLSKESRNLIWIPGKVLKDHGINPYSDLPFWRPNPQGFYHFNIDKALAAGLKNRPVADMIKDQLAGYDHRHPEDDFEFGHGGTLSRERETEMIGKWKEMKPSF